MVKKREWFKGYHGSLVHYRTHSFCNKIINQLSPRITNLHKAYCNSDNIIYPWIDESELWILLKAHEYMDGDLRVLYVYGMHPVRSCFFVSSFHRIPYYGATLKRLLEKVA
jgi:hypothetical protein